MTEKLTDGERLTLSMCGSAAEKCLRIIDAQAAGLDRVRTWADVYYTVKPRGLVDALAAAPEHTGPNRKDAFELVNELAAANARADAAKQEMTEALAREQGWRDRADAAEREQQRFEDACANGERVYDELAAKYRVAESERDEWKAKCEAAERALASNLPASYWNGKASEAVKRTESEAAALRAEVERLKSLLVIGGD